MNAHEAARAAMTSKIERARALGLYSVTVQLPLDHASALLDEPVPAADTGWEYGIHLTNGNIAPQTFSSYAYATLVAAAWQNGTVVRRRKAGPWEPVS